MEWQQTQTHFGVRFLLLKLSSHSIEVTSGALDFTNLDAPFGIAFEDQDPSASSLGGEGECEV